MPTFLLRLLCDEDVYILMPISMLVLRSIAGLGDIVFVVVVNVVLVDNVVRLSVVVIDVDRFLNDGLLSLE